MQLWAPHTENLSNTQGLSTCSGPREQKTIKHMDDRSLQKFIADVSQIVEEKLDGTNVSTHFSEANELVLQCRVHLITEGIRL